MLLFHHQTQLKIGLLTTFYIIYLLSSYNETFHPATTLFLSYNRMLSLGHSTNLQQALENICNNISFAVGRDSKTHNCYKKVKEI